MKKTSKFAALGLTAGLAAGGAAGLVLAVPAVSGAQSSTATTAESGTATSDTAPPERGARVAESLAPLVADGTLTQEQADKVVEALKDAFPGRGGPGELRGGGFGLDAAASALGLSVEELRTELEGGQTIAQVAEARGVDVQTVIDAAVADVKAHLDEEVAAGELTQEEADARLAERTERITDAVDRTFPALGDRGHRGGPGAGHGPGADADQDATTDTTEG